MLISQLAQARSLRQGDHRNQPTRRHEIRIIEPSRDRTRTMRKLHPRDALRVRGSKTFDKSDPPSTQGHSRVTTRYSTVPIGGSRLSSQWRTWGWGMVADDSGLARSLRVRADRHDRVLFVMERLPPIASSLTRATPVNVRSGDGTRLEEES